MTTDPTPDLTDTQKAYNVAQSEMFQLAAYGHHRYHPLVEALTDEGKRQQRDYNDRLLAARDALEAALLRLVAEHAETTNSRFVSVDWLRSLADDPGMLSLLAVRPDEREDTPVAPPVPAGRDALRDRIRRALAEADGFGFDGLEPHDYQAQAAAVVAVLPPPADRAAILRAAADELGRMDYDTDSNDYGYDTYRDAWNGGVMDGADLLRRLADEERDEREAQAHLDQLADELPSMDGEAQQPSEADGDRIVAYRSALPGALSVYCTNHTDELGGGVVPLTSDDLPNGGVCAGCGVDVLIPQEPRP